MSDGLSDYWRQRLAEAAGRGVFSREMRWPSIYDPDVYQPIVPRREAWSYTPPYFCLGRDAEAA